jgi:hypothetical protein
LDLVHHVVLLGEKRFAKLLRPVELVAHRLQHIGKLHERLYARVPILSFERFGKRITLGFRVGATPTRRLDDIQGVGRSHQHVRQQVIRIERYRRQELIKLLLR